MVHIDMHQMEILEALLSEEEIQYSVPRKELNPQMQTVNFNKMYISYS